MNMLKASTIKKPETSPSCLEPFGRHDGLPAPWRTVAHCAEPRRLRPGSVEDMLRSQMRERSDQ